MDPLGKYTEPACFSRIIIRNQDTFQRRMISSMKLEMIHTNMLPFDSQLQLNTIQMDSDGWFMSPCTGMAHFLGSGVCPLFDDRPPGFFSLAALCSQHRTPQLPTKLKKVWKTHSCLLSLTVSDTKNLFLWWIGSIQSHSPNFKGGQKASELLEYLGTIIVPTTYEMEKKLRLCDICDNCGLPQFPCQKTF